MKSKIRVTNKNKNSSQTKIVAKRNMPKIKMEKSTDKQE